MNKILFLDTTLRDGEQTPGISLTKDEKLLIAKEVDTLGVDIIEAGAVAVSDGERSAIKDIVKEGLNAEICTYSRATRSDIDYALDCNVDSIHLVVPTSELHMRKIGKNSEEVEDMVIESIKYAKDHGLIVELSGEDASRANLDNLIRLYKKGEEYKADRICLCDTVGILIPERTEEIFSKIKKEISIPIAIHAHDDFGLATANSIIALRNGASEVHVAINGLGERAGNTCLEEVSSALKFLYKEDIDIKMENIYKVSRTVSKITGINVQPNKAIVGNNAFTHEAGIHVHGIAKDPSTYEPIKPELVGRERRIVLGKHTGRKSVEIALKGFGLEFSKEDLEEIFKRVKEIGDRGRRITDGDLLAIAENVLALSYRQRVRLIEYNVVTGNKIKSTASMILDIDDKEHIEADVGVGPVDAAINALRKTISEITDISLDEYHVDAISGGTDALVDVSVKLSRNGKSITTSGVDVDIIKASIDAVISGINRLLK